MGRFTDLFQENKPAEEVFSAPSVAESVEVSAPEPVMEKAEVILPESVSEENELFESGESSSTRKTRKRTV